jgi:sorting nexin-8
MTNTMKALVEANGKCWRGDQCELCSGVNKGIAATANHCQRHADLLEQRVSDRTTFSCEAQY